MLDISADLVVLVLNTLYFYAEYNMEDEVTVEDQLSWLYTVLRDAPKDRKFIITMHIPPGIMLEKPFWNPSLESLFIYTIGEF